jgi:hypothetical protein
MGATKAPDLRGGGCAGRFRGCHTDLDGHFAGIGSRMLTDAEAEEIRRGLGAGMRGPVLIKWCEQLLADRDERVARERATATAFAAAELEPSPIPGFVEATSMEIDKR